jgi:subtilisin family serine protease
MTKRTSFRYSVFNGVSLQIHEQDLSEAVETCLILEAKMAQTSLVKNFWPVEIIYQSETSDMQNATAQGLQRHTATRLWDRQVADDTPVGGTTDNPPHGMTHVDQLHAKGFSGKGIKIGIVDSGIDYKHPALGGCFGQGCLVSFGYDFVGDSFEDSTSTPQPDDDPLAQCNGHETHVAGIIAAQENPMGFLGAAYGSSIGAYRVIGCSGYTTNELIIKGYCRAHADGADIITASITRLSGWNEDAITVIAQRIVDAGTVVLSGSGNDAVNYYSMFSVGSAATGLGVDAIGSVKSDRVAVLVKVGSFSTGDGPNGSFVYLSGRPVFAQSLSRRVWLVTPERTAEGDEWEVCNPLPDDTPDLSDFIILVEAGACGDEWTAQEFLHEKRAEFIIFYRDEPDM